MRSTSRFLKFSAALALAGAVFYATQSDAGDKAAGAKAPEARVIELAVTDKGFEPSPIKVKAGEPLSLRVTRKTEMTCATELVVPEHQINVALPLNKTVEVAFTPKKAGKLKYGCAMGQMIAGVLLVE